MRRRYACPKCFGYQTIKKGKRSGAERWLCLSCAHWFNINRKPRVKTVDLVNFHLKGLSFRKLSGGYGLHHSTICRRVNGYLEDLPSNIDLTRDLCSKFCGMLVLDGKYISIKSQKYGIPLIWGVDYLTHDIPHFRLAPAENYQSSVAFFQSLRLINYPLQCLISDDNVNFKMAAQKVYPKVVIQTCTNHYKENVRRTLGVRSQDTYRDFMGELEHLFREKRGLPEFDSLATKLYKKWSHDELLRSVLFDLERRKAELLGYLKVHGAPYTTNIIESYNSHLEARLKSIRSFESTKHARNWLNGYIIQRRLTKFTDCKGRFKDLNGKCSLELTLQDTSKLPSLFI